MFAAGDEVSAAVGSGFAGHKVVVVGDLILDRYLWGDVARISPEAPVPVLHLKRQGATAGGAANVARNLRELGLQVVLAGATGRDPHREALLGTLHAAGISTGPVIPVADRGTTVKTRVVGNHQQMLRIDEEVVDPIAPADAAELLARIVRELTDARALVLSDYAKGVLTGGLCEELVAIGRERGIPVLVDPKGREFARYRGATVVTPNRRELSQATGVPLEDLEGLLEAADRLRSELALDRVVLTLSEQGMVIVDSDGSTSLPAIPRDVYDVSGAGDTVVAVFAAGIVAGLTARDTGHLANLAASIVVGKVGTAQVSLAELEAAIADESALEQAAKICTRSEGVERVGGWQARGERVVFTNGCFDLLHVGHVTLLERARRLGHRLVVGLNTDRSVRMLKGTSRPLIGEQERARVLASLASVDAVVLFDDPTPRELILALRPDVLAKGADYRREEVVGAQEVMSWGGRVELVPIVEGASTTGIVERVNATSGGEV